jgi:S-adenosylmethionine:tRNA ribosyltransferase-isomerase
MSATSSFQKLLQQFDYQLPQNLIAQEPASPRDTARLLVYEKSTGKISFDVFANLGKYLPKNATLVFNQTKVVPARLEVTKETGGKTRLLYLGQDKTGIKALADRKLALGSALHLSKKDYFTVTQQKENHYFLKPSFPLTRILNVMTKQGRTPLPPYIKHSILTEAQRREKYQTVFAKTGVSVAAPTASLHFTKKLMNQLKKQGIGTAFVQLDVNLGTFAPLKEEQVKLGRLHQEFYKIDKSTTQTLNKAKVQGRPIIAVGTTVARTLESASKNGKLIKLTGQTDLFIQEDYKLQFVNGLITNFHVPKSSLLMLVSALVGRRKLFELYQKAIKKEFRFFSFGDGMLILP